MYCRKCGHEIPKGSTFCTKCGSSTDPRRDKEILRQKELERQQKEKKRAKEKKQDYANNPAVIGFALTLLSFVLAAAPTGVETQKQWWYLAIVILSAVAGVFFTYKGNQIDDALYRKHRIRLHPRLIQVSYLLGALVIVMWIIVMAQIAMGTL